MTALLITAAISFAAPPDSATMEAKEKTAWQSFKDKNKADFEKVVSADFCGVYYNGIYDMQKEVADMQNWDMKSFTLSDYKTVAAGQGTVIATYVVKVEGTYNGKDASGTFNCGSVWKKHKGEWQAIFHTNVKQQAATE
jgi:hypothetical protein